jgi:hypothetical protein
MAPPPQIAKEVVDGAAAVDGGVAVENHLPHGEILAIEDRAAAAIVLFAAGALAARKRETRNLDGSCFFVVFDLEVEDAVVEGGIDAELRGSGAQDAHLLFDVELPIGESDRSGQAVGKEDQVDRIVVIFIAIGGFDCGAQRAGPGDLLAVDIARVESVGHDKRGEQPAILELLEARAAAVGTLDQSQIARTPASRLTALLARTAAAKPGAVTHR